MSANLKMLCNRVKISSQWLASRPDTDSKEWQGASHWRVTLRYGKRQLTVLYSMGAAHTGEPNAADVVHSILSDASIADSAGSFEDFCSDLGYDNDSIKALKSYKACVRMAKKTAQFFGDDLQTFQEAAQDY